MSKSENERLLCGCGQQGNNEHKLKGYYKCVSDCTCGGVCKKCVMNKRQCVPDCDCTETCQKCNPEKKTKSRANRICVGAANILGRRPFSLYILLIFCVIFLIIFIALAVFMVLVHFHGLPHISMPRIGIPRIKHPHHRNRTALINKRISLCKDISAENGSLFIMGYLDARTDKGKQYIRPTKNVFYVPFQIITTDEACNIESVLRLLTDKLVYVIDFHESETNYLKHLQKRYVNLNRIKTNHTHFFEGSMFENDWNNSRESLSALAARVLAIWQFGGMALSEKLIMNSRDIVDATKEVCFADKDVVYCPQECSAYTFELMKAILDEMKKGDLGVNLTDDVENLIDISIRDFCSGDVAKIGCNRVHRLQKGDMCEDDSGSCQFIRADTLRTFPHYRTLLPNFCPHISSIME